MAAPLSRKAFYMYMVCLPLGRLANHVHIKAWEAGGKQMVINKRCR